MSLRRVLSACLVAGLTLALPATAGAKPAKKVQPPRVITIAYSQPCGETPKPTGGNGSVSNCPADQAFDTLKGEKFASIQVTDASGLPTAVIFNVATTGVSDQLPTIVCGSASKLDIEGGARYAANPVISVGDTGCPTPPTSGTIKITLTRN